MFVPRLKCPDLSNGETVTTKVFTLMCSVNARGIFRKVDGYVAQILSSLRESGIDDLAVGFAHEKAASIHLFEDFRADQGFRAVLHGMLEIEVQILEIAGQDAISDRLGEATRHADPESQAKSASASIFSTAFAGVVSFAAYSSLGVRYRLPL